MFAQQIDVLQFVLLRNRNLCSSRFKLECFQRSERLVLRGKVEIENIRDIVVPRRKQER